MQPPPILAPAVKAPTHRLRKTEPKEPAFIADSRGRLYLHPDMLRLLSSLLAALALFWSPIAMASGAGMAMPATVEMTASAAHCPDSDAPPEDRQSDVKMSCASSCAAFPALAPAIADRPRSFRAEVEIAKGKVLVGIDSERETPPPRNTSGI